MSSTTKLFQFNNFNSDDINQRFTKRHGELKIAQNVVSSTAAKFVILGIEESIGPVANKGRSGAENGFEAFLNKFLNMQSNQSLIGDNVCVLGKVSRTNKQIDEQNIFNAVDELDQFVYKILSDNVMNNQIPIIIGGGHNNAYPIIKYIYTKINAQLDVVNLDAHADYRPLEGRHSGNPFSYAFHDGFIHNYSVFGLHQRYNSQKILDDLAKDNHMFTYFEDYIDGTKDLKIDIEQFYKKNKHKNIGLELDLDAIEKMPSSASSPSGISMDLARFYVRKLAKLENIAYLHLPEGAPLNESENVVVGKTLAYLVTDFISAYDISKL